MYKSNKSKPSLRWLVDTLSASVAQKFVMALTGFFLIIFLAVHAGGNMLLLKGDEGAAFNAYSELLIQSKLIKIVEFFLLFGFFFHISTGVKLSIENKRARPVRYAVNHASENSPWYSRNMIHTGGIILIFLIVHLKNFFYEHRILTSEHTMYESVKMTFENTGYALFYIAAMALMMFHLLHGFESAFQTLGLRHNKYTLLIKILGKGYAFVVPLLFASGPIYFLIGAP